MSTMTIFHPGRTSEMPYRLFALFQKMDGDWTWRVFSGSEPAKPPT